MAKREGKHGECAANIRFGHKGGSAAEGAYHAHEPKALPNQRLPGDHFDSDGLSGGTERGTSRGMDAEQGERSEGETA